MPAKLSKVTKWPLPFWSEDGKRHFAFAFEYKEDGFVVAIYHKYLSNTLCGLSTKEGSKYTPSMLSCSENKPPLDYEECVHCNAIGMNYSDNALKEMRKEILAKEEDVAEII